MVRFVLLLLLFNFVMHRIISTVVVAFEINYLILYGLSNGAIFNDLERPLTWFSRSRHSLTLNISQTATDTAIVTIEGE